VQLLFNEISIMNQLDHPFILKLNGVAQDKRIVYMYTDYLPSGDLMGILNEFDKLNLEFT
jgi:serine/threonine protein kinase